VKSRTCLEVWVCREQEEEEEDLSGIAAMVQNKSKPKANRSVNGQAVNVQNKRKWFLLS
jgi:hypothetical protein